MVLEWMPIYQSVPSRLVAGTPSKILATLGRCPKMQFLVKWCELLSLFDWDWLQGLNLTRCEMVPHLATNPKGILLVSIFISIISIMIYDYSRQCTVCSRTGEKLDNCMLGCHFHWSNLTDWKHLILRYLMEVIKWNCGNNIWFLQQQQ